MDERKITRQTIVWMALSALAAGLFWHGWQLTTGSIPTVNTLTMVTEDQSKSGDVTPAWWVITPPYPLSRSWDPFFLPVFAFLLVKLHQRFRVPEERKNDMVPGLIVGVVLGLLFGVLPGMLVGLTASMFMLLLTGLIVVVGIGRIEALDYSVGFCLMLGVRWGFLPALLLLLTLWAPILTAWFIIRGVTRQIGKIWKEWSICAALKEIVKGEPI